MVQAQWEIHGVNCSDCCGPDDSCRPYPPCCIRDLRFKYTALVSTVDAAGPLSEATVKRMTIKNSCNGQVSVDHSRFDFFDSSGAEGATSVTFSGRADQGCLFGIDITAEDLMCVCPPGAPRTDQFVIEIEICNPLDETIYFQPQHGSTSLCFWFEEPASTPCCLVLETTEPAATAISAGSSHVFTLDFSIADWTLCVDCYTPGPDTIVEDEFYFPTDGFDTTCLRPIYCDTGAAAAWTPGDSTTDCEASECPPCGCYLDLDGGCICGCEGEEAMGSCAPPKAILPGCSDDSGQMQICAETAVGVGLRVMEVRDSACHLIGIISRLDASNTWTFAIFSADGDVTHGGSAGVVPTGLPVCGFYTVRWSHTGAGSTITIEVDGDIGTGTVSADYVDWDGVCYALATPGSTYTLRF